MQLSNTEYQPTKFMRDIVLAILLALSMIITIVFVKINNIDIMRTIIGPFFGFVGALFIYVTGLLIEDIEKYRTERNNTQYVFELYKIEVNKNIGHIQHMINKKWIPYYRLKTITRDNLWGVLADYSKDVDFMAKLNDTYAEYELINNKTDIMNSVRIAKLSATNKEIENKLADEVNNQLSGCIGLGQNAIKMSSDCLAIIEEKIKKTNKPFFSELIFCVKKKITGIFSWLTLMCKSIPCDNILKKGNGMDRASSKYKINWVAISAIGTICAVIWAIYHQEIRDVINRPVFEVTFFEKASPYLVEQMGASIENTGSKEYTGFFITVQLINVGKTIAKDVQPLLTAVGYKDEKGMWNREIDWIAIPLQWVLGETSLQRDLVPERPYMFNLGSFSKARVGRFLFTYVMSPKAQKETVGPGEYCFEVTIFSVNAKTEKKYVYVKFNEFNWDVGSEQVKKIVKVEMKNSPPWREK